MVWILQMYIAFMAVLIDDLLQSVLETYNIYMLRLSQQVRGFLLDLKDISFVVGQYLAANYVAVKLFDIVYHTPRSEFVNVY